MHDILSNWERRAVLYYLQEWEQPASVEVIARHLVGWRRGGEDPAPRDDEAVSRFRTRLVHEHVLKMETFGVLAFDSRENTVQLTDGMKVTVSTPWSQDAAKQSGQRAVAEEA